MLYLEDTKWKTYEPNNDMINLYLNIRDIGRYIKSNGINNIGYTIIDKPWRIKKGTFYKAKCNLDNIFELDKISYNHRQILDRFNIKNINSISDFLNLVDDYTDFMLFLQRIGVDISIFRIPDYIVEEDKKKIIKYSYITISIETTLVPSINKSGSVILDMIDSKSKDKYVTFFNIRLDKIGSERNTIHKVYQFISGENPELDIEDKVVISDMADNFIIHMLKFYKISIAQAIGDNSLCSETISNYLEKGEICTKICPKPVEAP